MRYFTKEWYGLISTVDESLKALPGDDASEGAISRLYQQALAKFLKEDRDEYNTAPAPFEDSLSAEDLADLTASAESATMPKQGFDFDHWDFFEDHRGDVTLWRHPYETEEVLAVNNRTLEEELALFEKRPAYNPAPAVDFFKEGFEAKQKDARDLPDFVTSAVDARIIALGYLPSEVLKKYRAYCEKAHEQFDDIMQCGEAALAKEDIPDEVIDAVYLHDSGLLGLDTFGRDLVLLVQLDGWFGGGETAYRKITFFDAEVLELEDSLLNAETACFLETELYRRKEGGYEVHFLFDLGLGDEMAYLTLRCKDIKSEEAEIEE